MANLKFKRVSATPTTGDIGDIYFVDNGTERSIYVCTATNTFTKYAETERELLSNKTTSLSESSTDTQYPSAKCVYDIIVDNEEVFATAINTLNEQKENLSNKTTSISSSSTYDQYPAARTVYDNLITKEDVSNKITSLSSSSTDTQYPSAKAVYDNLALKEDVSNKITSLSSSSTDTQYPSAKCVYDIIVDNEEVVTAAINNLTNRLDNILSINITSNGTTLTLQQWIDRISAITVDV